MKESLLFTLAVIFIFIISGSDRLDKIPVSGDHGCCHSHNIRSLSSNIPEINLSQKKLIAWAEILRSVRETFPGNRDSDTNELSATVLRSYLTKVTALKPLTGRQYRSLHRIPVKEDDHNHS